MSLLEKLQEKEESLRKKREIQFWKPGEGEILQGVVTELGKTITTSGEAHYIQIKTDDKRDIIVFTNEILRKQLEEENVQQGDRVAIKFLGYQRSKRNPRRRYKNFILVKDNESEG